MSNGFLSTTYPLTITVTNQQPTFNLSTPGEIPCPDLFVPLNKPDAWFTIKGFSDQEGHLEGSTLGGVTLSVLSKSSGTLVVDMEYTPNRRLRVFSNAYADVITPVLLVLNLKDGGATTGTLETITVHVTNTPPVFTGSVPGNLTFKLNQLVTYVLPPYHDPEQLPVFVTLGGTNTILVSSASVSTD